MAAGRNGLETGMDIGQIIRCHRQDDLAGVDAGYRAFLAGTPGHLQAIQMPGLLLMQIRRSAEAADHFRLVVEAQPGNLDQWANFASSLRSTGRMRPVMLVGGRSRSIRSSWGLSTAGGLDGWPVRRGDAGPATAGMSCRPRWRAITFIAVAACPLLRGCSSCSRRAKRRRSRRAWRNSVAGRCCGRTMRSSNACRPLTA